MGTVVVLLLYLGRVDMIIPPISSAGVFALVALGISAPDVYAYDGARWSLTFCGVDYWLLDDDFGVRIVESF